MRRPSPWRIDHAGSAGAGLYRIVDADDTLLATFIRDRVIVDRMIEVMNLADGLTLEEVKKALKTRRNINRQRAARAMEGATA